MSESLNINFINHLFWSLYNILATVYQIGIAKINTNSLNISYLNQENIFCLNKYIITIKINIPIVMNKFYYESNHEEAFNLLNISERKIINKHGRISKYMY